MAEQLHKKIFPSDECDISPTDELWIVYDEDKTGVGFCSVRPLEHNIAYLNWAGLTEAGRGQGLHKRMIQTRERWCRKNEFESIITYTTVDNIQSARNLLKSGYELFLPEYTWAGKNFLYFQKIL